jgi:hypothetical protein
MPALEVRRRDGASKSSTEAMGRRGDGGRTGRNGGGTQCTSEALGGSGSRE